MKNSKRDRFVEFISGKEIHFLIGLAVLFFSNFRGFNMVGLKLEYLYDAKNSSVGRCFVVKNNESQIGMAIFKELNSIDVYLKHSVTQNIKKFNIFRYTFGFR